MPDPSSNHSRLDTLLAHLVDETVTSEELSELEALLDQNPEAQRRYLRYLDLHKELQHSVPSAPESSPKTTPFPLWPRLIIGLAAAAILMIVGFLLLQPSEESTIARVAALGGAVRWTGNGGEVIESLSVGAPLRGGTIESTAADARAEIVFTDGTRVTVSGISALTISDRRQKELHFRHGHLSAQVSAQPTGNPMVLHTPTTRVEVLGTRFNVLATTTSTLLNVEEGKVRVTRKVDGGSVIVPTDYQVDVSLDRTTELKSTRRPDKQGSWKSRLPLGIHLGELAWNKKDGTPTLKATPNLWRGRQGELDPPLLVYSLVLDLAQIDQPPVELREGARFRVQGRMESPKTLVIGVGTRNPNGKLPGKHEVRLPVQQHFPTAGSFDIEIPIKDFVRDSPIDPASLIGLEPYAWWCATIKEDAGLEIHSVELLEGNL